MKTVGKYKKVVEGKSGYRNTPYFSGFSRNKKMNENQEFVVPWQMTKMEESGIRGK